MSEPVIVVATFDALPGMAERVIDAFREVSPLVHREKGCELYAAHRSGDTVVMIERWTDRQDLDAHAAGDPLVRLNELTAGLLTHPYDVYFLDRVPLGDPTKGIV